MADIVIQVPVELKPIADGIKTLLTQAQSALGCAGVGITRRAKLALRIVARDLTLTSLRCSRSGG